MAMTNGEMLAFFPTPYPDETIYSVLCRLYLRLNCLTYRQLSEKFLGQRMFLNAFFPKCFSALASHLPESTGLTPDYFICQTTIFPYFAPFLTHDRQGTILDYMTKRNTTKGNNISVVGTNTLRQPKSLYLRFCKSCWRDDIQSHGEEYWHRVHQLPGVLMCHHHEEPLMDAPILIYTANRGFYAASFDMSEKSNVCGNFSSYTVEKLIQLSQNSQWLLDNGHLYETFEQTSHNYSSWLSNTGYSSSNGHMRHKEIYDAVNDLYGEEFLKLVGAYNKDTTTETWTRRFMVRPYKLRHPMYHILLHMLLAGSTPEFFNGDPQKSQPQALHDPPKQKKKRNKKPVFTEGEKCILLRQTWKQLIYDNPGANRTYLKRLSPSCYKWLRENDLLWFENNLPAAQSVMHFDWNARDLDVLEIVRETVNGLRNTAGKPIWISRRRIARQAGLDRIKSKEALIRMPKTAAYLSSNVESREDWLMRVLDWENLGLRKMCN